MIEIAPEIPLVVTFPVPDPPVTLSVCPKFIGYVADETILPPETIALVDVYAAYCSVQVNALFKEYCEYVNHTNGAELVGVELTALNP